MERTNESARVAFYCNTHESGFCRPMKRRSPRPGKLCGVGRHQRPLLRRQRPRAILCPAIRDRFRSRAHRPESQRCQARGSATGTAKLNRRTTPAGSGGTTPKTPAADGRTKLQRSLLGFHTAAELERLHVFRRRNTRYRLLDFLNVGRECVEHPAGIGLQVLHPVFQHCGVSDPAGGA